MCFKTKQHQRVCSDKNEANLYPHTTTKNQWKQCEIPTGYKITNFNKEKQHLAHYAKIFILY